VLAAVVAIGVIGHSGPAEPTASPSVRVVAVAVTVAPSAEPSAVERIVPVDRLNKFVIDDAVRGPHLRFVVRMRAIGVPRAI
jgi:hypothetical protein